MPELNIELQLTPEILPGQIVVEIADAGKYIEQPAGKETVKKLAIGVKFRDKIFRWLPNERSLSNCAASWGMSTVSWIGKKVQLWKTTRFAFGENREIIYGKPA